MYQSNVNYSERKPKLNKQKVTIVGIIIALIGGDNILCK